MSTNLNVAPYYDDFDETKGFQQIVFKPGYAVQARELTQMQSIIKDQIAKFGNHIFQHGSVVIPGNSFFDNQVPYIKVATITTVVKDLLIAAQSNSITVVGTTSGVRAIIKNVVDSTLTDPVTLYVGFIKGNAFQNSEVLQVEGTVHTFTLEAAASSGFGSIAYVNKGVYYVNGEFGLVLGQSVITQKYTTTPTCRVLLKIHSSIVSSDQDESLLDPAQGSYNFSAPGADRIKLLLELTTAQIEETISDDCFELLRLENGGLISHARNAKYSELDKTFARRTFDESGNYLVNGFDIQLLEHKKTQINGGVSATGSVDNFVARIGPGKAYVGGYETERLASTQVVLPKARSAEHQMESQVSSKFDYGTTLYVADLKKLPLFHELEVVNFYDTSAVSGGSIVATAKVIFTDYVDGAGTTTIYKLALTDLVFTGVNSYDNIGGFRAEAVGGSGSTGSVVKKLAVNTVSGIFVTADVLTVAGQTATGTISYSDPAAGIMYVKKHTSGNLVPKVGDKVTGGTSSASASVIAMSNFETNYSNTFMIPIAVRGLKTTKNIQNAHINNYKVWKTFTFATNGAGAGSYTISQGEFDNLEASAFIATTTAGVVSVQLFQIQGDGKTLSITGGPASVTISVSAVVVLQNSVPKTKTVMSGTKVIGAGLATNSIQLDHADIIRVQSVISGGVDVTPNWALDNGQRDFYYQKGVLNRKFGALPSTSITINYTYFEHSVGGEFFTIDSYPTPEDIPSYKQQSTNITWPLRAVIDFRKKWDPTTGIDGTLSAPVSGSRFETAYVKYLPRIDVIALNKDSSVSVVEGIPAENPAAPRIGTGSMGLYALIVPAQTPIVSNIRVVSLYTPGYTMQEIDNINKRINRLEKYVTATDSEQELIQKEIPDALTGLNKFKTGYLVDQFTSPLLLGHSTHPEFSVSYGATGPFRGITAGAVSYGPNVIMHNSTGIRNTNGLITLDYTERTLINQNQSTRVTNVNPFLTFSWVGNMTITPQNYTWSTTDWRSAIINDVTQVVDNVITIQEPDVIIPWATPVIQPSGSGGGDNSPRSPFSTTTNQWGEQVTVLNTSVTGGFATMRDDLASLQDLARSWGVDLNQAPLSGQPTNDGTGFVLSADGSAYNPSGLFSEPVRG